MECRIKFRKQYIASDRPIEGLGDDFLEEKIGALRIYRHRELDCFRAKKKAAGAAGGSGRIELLALGFMIDPRRPEAESEEILEGLAAEAADGSGGYPGFSRLMEALQEITGRYALFYEGPDGRFAINDACALRSIYYTRGGRLGIDWELLVTEPLREDFLQVYEAEHTFPRRLPKTRRIQYLYDHHRGDGSLVINGNCTEIARTNYGTVKFSTPGAMADVIGYPWQPYVLRKCQEWLDDTEDFTRQYGIPRADLIYWEMRMGNWHALHAHEQDIAAEEFSPFNHKGIILALLSVDVRRRLPPDYPFFHDLIAAMWPECLDPKFRTKL
ncbi:MAG: hypothetical protein SVR04_04395 [Spirochaetota bacterium]|nr:hypothetical protein [Spirochaetota bacterium]